MQLRGTAIVVDTVAAKKPVISGSGATRTLNEYESGSLVLFDRAAGITYTLPSSASATGVTYDFLVTAVPASTAKYIITTNGTQKLIGSVDVLPRTANPGASSSPVTWTAGTDAGSSYIKISMDGSTTGGIIGSYLTLTALSSNTWYVTGMTVGTLTLATPFSA